MYRNVSTVEIHIDYTYRRLFFKCIAKTAICTSMSADKACEYAQYIGTCCLENRLKDINKNYGIKIISTHYSKNKKYKFIGDTVIDCTATVQYSVTFMGGVLSKGMGIDIIQNLIKRYNGINKYSVG